MRSVVDLALRDANITLNAEDRDRRAQQFVDDAYYQESQLAQVR